LQDGSTRNTLTFKQLCDEDFYTKSLAKLGDRSIYNYFLSSGLSRTYFNPEGLVIAAPYCYDFFYGDRRCFGKIGDDPGGGFSGPNPKVRPFCLDILCAPFQGELPGGLVQDCPRPTPKPSPAVSSDSITIEKDTVYYWSVLISCDSHFISSLFESPQSVPLVSRPHLSPPLNLLLLVLRLVQAIHLLCHLHLNQHVVVLKEGGRATRLLAAGGGRGNVLQNLFRNSMCYAQICVKVEEVSAGKNIKSSSWRLTLL